MDGQVITFIDRLPNPPAYKQWLVSLWRSFLALGLPNAHFVKEFTNGKNETFLQRIWEMMVAHHLDAQGHHHTPFEHGPDFRFEHRGLTVWVEAIAPGPKGLPSDWMIGPDRRFKVVNFPHQEILLRWTAALKAKWEKYCIYCRKGIVRENDAYVIAINGCQLGAHPMNEGISGFPFAAQAAYCIGPLSLCIDQKTRRVLQTNLAGHYER